jgi:hypothetical protein
VIARRAVIAAAVCLLARPVAGQGIFAMADAWIPADAVDWRYLGDSVMGGVSHGEARLEGGALRLTGTVSTANRGGFIQARTELPDGLPEAATGLRLRVRGNGGRYFIHLRSTRTALPWQYFQQGFETGPDWADVTLPLADFAPSGRMMAGGLRAAEVRSLGLVAYGRDHEADVSLAGFGVF